MPWYMKKDDRRYTLARWKRLRQLQLANEPLCKMCDMRSKHGVGSISAAVEVHHIVPVSVKHGDESFYDMDNLMSLCKQCHISITAYNRRESPNPPHFTDFNGRYRHAITGEIFEMQIEPKKPRKYKVY